MTSKSDVPLCDICQRTHLDKPATYVATWRNDEKRYYCDEHNRLMRLLAKSWMITHTEPITSQS